MSDQNFQGKKTFLLYPHSVIRDEMLDMLLMAGFATYTLMDIVKARRLLEKFPDSLMFINIDEGLKEYEWEDYMRGIQTNPKTKECRLGILSYNQDRALMQKYLMELSIPCGYIQLKLGFNESTKIILNALDANEAKGRRQCIRADCHDDISATLNFMIGNERYRGKLLDISSSGLATRFDSVLNLPANSLLPNVQLRLRGGLVLMDMILMGQRHDDKRVSILLFNSKIPIDDKLIIHRYIKQCLQKYIDGLKI